MSVENQKQQLAMELFGQEIFVVLILHQIRLMSESHVLLGI